MKHNLLITRKLLEVVRSGKARNFHEAGKVLAKKKKLKNNSLVINNMPSSLLGQRMPYKDDTFD